MSIVQLANFQAAAGAICQAINPTVTSQQATLTPDGYGASDLYIYNASDKDIAIVGGSAPVAILPIVNTPGHIVVPKGGTMILNWPEAWTKAAIIASGAATGNCYLCLGKGN